MKCPNCSNELSFILIDDEKTYYCERCGYGVATQNVLPYEDDKNIYEIRILPNEISTELISAYKRIFKCNSIQAMKELKDGGKVVSGAAYDILPLRDELKYNNVKFSITIKD